jgi:hypothetical protein
VRLKNSDCGFELNHAGKHPRSGVDLLAVVLLAEPPQMRYCSCGGGSCKFVQRSKNTNALDCGLARGGRSDSLNKSFDRLPLDSFSGQDSEVQCGFVILQDEIESRAVLSPPNDF